MTETPGAFERERYVVLPALLSEPSLSRYYRYACKVGGALRVDRGDDQVPGTPAVYGDVMMDGLLDNLLPEIQRASGLALFSTYSYFRVYKRGDTLEKHTDRPSCEVSVTLCLGFQGPGPWPFFVEGPRGAISIGLAAGDALLYRGIECPHWREAFEGQRQAQVFLHYVDQNGPFSEWKFDKRESITRLPGRR